VTKPLASGPENAQIDPARAMPDAAPCKFLDLPGVAAVEHAKSTRGAEWLPENDDLPQRIDKLSIKYFGITEADTATSEPQQWQFQKPSPLGARFGEVDDTDAFYEARIEWLDREAFFDVLNIEGVPDDDVAEFWLEFGLDVLRPDGRPARCLSVFGRQMLCAAVGAHPKAKLMLDGSGLPPEREYDVEQWASALERSAREFKRAK